METVQSGAQKDFNVIRGGSNRNKNNSKATEICYAECDGEGESGNGARPAAPELRRRGEGRAARDVQEKAEGAGPPPPAPPVRSSSRVPKRPRWDAPPAPSPPKKPTKGESKAAATNGTPEAKTRRQWELWSSMDKDLFFEALNEHGKDFEAIQSVIAQRHRKRGNSQSIIRTKEQIRHFYYRTWHKIAKHIGIKKDVGKHTMELYGLVNYGEFRKRIGGNLNEKSGLKLNELIQKGATVVKTKGKNFRIRTPVCRALKKLNNIEETKDDEQVVIPKLLTLELRPVSNAAWATVQAISHNPRLRIHLPSNKRLSAVVDFLNKKWKSHRLRIKESMKAPEERTKELVLTPPTNCELYPFDVTPISSAPSVNLALEKFKDSSKDGKNDGTRSPAAKRLKRNTVSEEHHSENSAHSVEDIATQGDAVTTTETDNIEQAGTSGPKKGPVATAQPEAVTYETSTQPEVSTERSAVDDNPESGKDAGGVVNAECENKEAKEEALRKERIETLQKGWNLKAAQGITIAELYLLLGCPEKLMLEYDWVDLVKNDNVMQMNLALTNMLRRLVQLATTEFSEFSKSKPPMTVESSPPKICNCGGQMMTPPGRNAKNCRSGGGSTPKGGVKPGAAAVSKTSTGTQVPEENGEGVRGNTPVLASGSGGDGVFRVPNPVPVRPQPPVVRITPGSLQERHFLQQIELHKQKQHHDILMPRKQKKQVMRNIRRQPLVVQRTLLPKTGVPTRQIMTFTMMPNQSQMAQTGSFLPVVPGQTAGQAQAPVTTTSSEVPATAPVTVASPAQLSLSGLTVVGRSVGGQQSLLAQAASAAGITPAEADMAAPSDSQADSTSPNLSAILDISLPSVESNDGATNDSTFLSSISNSSFSGLLDNAMPSRVTVDVNEDSMSLPASASSPNKSFKLSSSLGPDSQWMNGDDFSLSQFLSDSPLKRSSNDPTLVSECSRESIRLDVDTALQSMMNENSMEYSSKFADLAAQIAANAPDIVSSRLRKT